MCCEVNFKFIFIIYFCVFRHSSLSSSVLVCWIKREKESEDVGEETAKEISTSHNLSATTTTTTRQKNQIWKLLKTAQVTNENERHEYIVQRNVNYGGGQRPRRDLNKKRRIKHDANKLTVRFVWRSLCGGGSHQLRPNNNNNLQVSPQISAPPAYLCRPPSREQNVRI